MSRLLPPLTRLLPCLALHAVAAAGPDGLESVVRPFFAEHCNRCHDARKQKGDLRVDNLAFNFESPRALMQWEEIMNRINSGDMPPEDEEKPEPGDIAK